VAHQLAVGQLVLLAPSLDAARGDADPAVRRGQRTRVEAGVRDEPVTPLLWQRVDPVESQGGVRVVMGEEARVMVMSMTVMLAAAR